MPSHYDVLPDLAFGHHPVHGIVAANPKNLAASTWMLKGFDFHPVPDQPTLYALADQNRDGHGRTSRAIELLRKAGYQVDVDAALDPAPRPKQHRYATAVRSVNQTSPSPITRSSASSQPSTTASPASAGSRWWRTAGGTTRAWTSTRSPRPPIASRRWGKSPTPRWPCTVQGSRSQCSPASLKR